VPVAAARLRPRFGFEQAPKVAPCFRLYFRVANARGKVNGKESVTEWSRIVSYLAQCALYRHRARWRSRTEACNVTRPRIIRRIALVRWRKYRAWIPMWINQDTKRRSVAGDREIRGFVESRPNRGNGTRRTGVKLPARPLIVPSWSYPLCIRCAVQMTDASGETRGERVRVAHWYVVRRECDKSCSVIVIDRWFHRRSADTRANSDSSKWKVRRENSASRFASKCRVAQHFGALCSVWEAFRSNGTIGRIAVIRLVSHDSIIN